MGRKGEEWIVFIYTQAHKYYIQNGLRRTHRAFPSQDDGEPKRRHHNASCYEVGQLSARAAGFCAVTEASGYEGRDWAQHVENQDKQWPVYPEEMEPRFEFSLSNCQEGKTNTGSSFSVGICSRLSLQWGFPTQYRYFAMQSIL